MVVNLLKLPEDTDNTKVVLLFDNMPRWPRGTEHLIMTTCHVGAADVNLLKVPEGMDDKKVVLLSDIMPTGWHGTVLANVQKGDRVAVWGCGPGVPVLPS